MQDCMSIAGTKGDTGACLRLMARNDPSIKSTETGSSLGLSWREVKSGQHIGNILAVLGSKARSRAHCSGCKGLLA